MGISLLLPITALKYCAVFHNNGSAWYAVVQNLGCALSTE